MVVTGADHPVRPADGRTESWQATRARSEAHLSAVPSIISAGVGLDLGATRHMPLRSRAISACATCGGISQAQNASRSISLAAVLSLPQADKETIFT